ncbi:flavodoxin [Bifidobacterium sp. 64T4]|uniref:flavodoxin n=1 Tax=Bifidobacterium pongonis TaxID=2834432 RepID=UPI001C579A42|nr:flavodoxin [Bifidobacterium pongonis]MBW3094755.1 flavodoxin [Bifidobacterium pongonis]
MIIVCFSHAGENYNVGTVDEGNTAKTADLIAERTGCGIVRIVSDTPYPSDYTAATRVAQDEANRQARPAITLEGDVDALDSDNTVLLGYPIWWGDAPMPVYSFLESRDWEGKTIHPFCTHEGSGLGDSVASIADATDADIQPGLAIRGTDAQRDTTKTARLVDAWLERSGLL